MRHGVPECIEKDADGFSTVVRLWHESIRPIGDLCPSNAADITSKQTSQILKETETGAERGKVGVRDPTPCL
jgi:hypothetical protein